MRSLVRPRRRGGEFYGLLRQIALVEEVLIELCDSFAVAVLVVLAGIDLILEAVAADEPVADGPQLLHDHFPARQDLPAAAQEAERGHQQEHDHIPRAFLPPRIGANSGETAHVGEQQQSHSKYIGADDNDIVPEFGEAQQGDHVERVENLDDQHDDACDFRDSEHAGEDGEDAAPGDEGEQHVVLGVPLLAGHLLQQHVVVRVVHLEALPVAGHCQSHQHHQRLHEGEDGQHQREQLEGGLRVGSADLRHAAEHQDVEDEGDDPRGEDDLLAPHQHRSRTVRDAFHQQQQQPEHPQDAHHHDELRPERVRETVVPRHRQVSGLQRHASSFEAVPPADQRAQLQVLEDVPVHADAHGEQKEVEEGDDGGDSDVGRHLRGGGRSGATPEEHVAVVGQAGETSVGTAVGTAGIALRRAPSRHHPDPPRHCYQLQHLSQTYPIISHLTQPPHAEWWWGGEWGGWGSGGVGEWGSGGVGWQSGGSYTVMDGMEESESKVGMSAYLVNNSFRSCLQPKRQSFDIKLYMQLHKKILRKAIIHKNFEQSLTNFEHKVDPTPKGFKGRQLQEPHVKHLFSTRDKRANTEVASLRSTETHSPLTHANTQSNTLKNTLNNTQMMASRPLTRERAAERRQERLKVRTEGGCELLERDFKYAGAQTSHFKPNMMYNLSLYRKNFKRADFRNDRICIKVVPGQIHKPQSHSLRQL